MSLTIKHVPDARWALGPSVWGAVYTLSPGTSDYPSGGYVIGSSGVAVSGLVNFYGAYLIGANSTFTSLGYSTVFEVAQTATPVASVTSFKLKIKAIVAAVGAVTNAVGIVSNKFTAQTTAGTIGDDEIAASTDLSGSVWTVVMLGY